MADTGQELSNAVSNIPDASSDHHHIEEAMSKLRLGDGPNQNPNAYPDRPGEPDCTYYLRTGTCAYGSNCRYNHPAHIGQGTQYLGELPQREGQPDCQFYLKTGTCRFGSTCKYHHPREKLNTRPIYYNSLGLPIREGEKWCPYYMKTGYCKFGTACKFSHPEPAASSGGATSGPTASSLVPTSGGFPLMGGGGFPAWPISRAPYVPSNPRMPAAPTPLPPPPAAAAATYMPFVLQSNHNSLPLQPAWTAYMQHQQGSAGHIALSDVVGPGQLSGTANNHQQQQQMGSDMLVNNLPERPEQPECQYYMKTGSCKYGNSCKYHHPKDRNNHPSSPINPPIGPLGLPLRPGQPVCSYYTMYGTCKFGLNCKYDHPFVGYYNYPPLTGFSIQDPYYPFSTHEHPRNSHVIITDPDPSALLTENHGEPSSLSPLDHQSDNNPNIN